MDIASSALEAQQQAMDVVSENVANAATPGYTRQVADLVEGTSVSTNVDGASSYAVIGSGVNVAQVQRMTDQFINDQVRIATGQSSLWQTQSQTLSQVESDFNEPSTSGLQSLFSAFWNSWSALSSDPNDSATQEGVISAGNNLAQGIQGVYSSVQQTDNDQKAQLSDDVTQINTLTSRIAQLNSQVSCASSGTDVNTLLDNEDSLITQLTGLAGVSVSGQDGGQLMITLGGKALVQGGISAQLGVRTNGSGQQEVYSISDGDAVNVTGGEVGGLLNLVNQTLPGIMTSLNNLTTTMVNEVNDTYATGVLNNGFGAGDFFTPGSTAADISVQATAGSVATSTTGSLGDGSLATELSNLGDTTLPSGHSINQMYQQIVTNVGTQSATATSMATTQNLSLTQFQTQQQSVSGVSLDEEMTNMIQYQQAYSAASRVITTIDSMISTLVNSTGVVSGS